MYEQIINLLNYSREEISVALKMKSYRRFRVNVSAATSTIENPLLIPQFVFGLFQLRRNPST